MNVDDTNGMSWLFSDSGTQTYTKTFRCDEDKGTHTNTATIRETGQSDDASVTVTCKPPPLRAGLHADAGLLEDALQVRPRANYDATWALIGEDTTFFLSGKTWYQAITRRPQGGTPTTSSRTSTSRRG